MILYKEIRGMQPYLEKARAKGSKIGFVPTMGALHQGHLSLIQQARSENDLVVCSIFVNPTQFNDPKDFEKYPVTLDSDILLLKQAATDVLFLPSVQEVYPNGVQQQHHYNLGYLETILEGAFRPGHFQGVCQVVHRLLTIVQPQRLYLGQKDYQQVMVLKKLVELEQLPVEIRVGSTRRETEGLAMSSRNMRLSADDRHKALAIYQALSTMRQQLPGKPVDVLKEEATRFLLQQGFEKVDYVEISKADSLLPAADTDKDQPLVGLVAAFMNGVRLIDNLLLN